MIVGIFGETRMGKSTLLKRLIASKQTHRAIVVDPLGKLGHLGVCVGNLAEFKRYWRKQYRGDFRIVIQPGILRPNTPPREVVAPFLHVAMKAADGSPPFWVMIDEVDHFGKIDAEIRAVADYGGNFGVSLAFVLRRPACVDRTLTAQASSLYLFRTKETVDLEYFKPIIGREATARLPGLAVFRALRWTGAGQPIETVDVTPIGNPKSNPTPETAPEAVPSTAPDEKPDKPAPEIDAASGEAELRPEECTVLSLKEFAARFGYASPHKFRTAILDSGRIKYRRLGHRAFMVRVSDLPAGKDAV